jgi:hypothetical protein
MMMIMMVMMVIVYEKTWPFAKNSAVVVVVSCGRAPRSRKQRDRERQRERERERKAGTGPPISEIRTAGAKKYNREKPKRKSVDCLFCGRVFSRGTS